MLLAVVAILVFPRTEALRNFYTAAVFEHARFGTENDTARLIVDTNLGFYKKATEIAKSKGADVIVFPEYGIFSPGDRPQLKNYLEMIPDPRKVRANPCEEHEAYSQRPILQTLSCLARNNSMFIVANTGDIQNCEGDPDCPSDGVFHFNTNVVFDREGALLVRYHKEHLFYEFGMDLAREQQNTTFVTDFGTFATYICFDIDFERMSQVARWPAVDGVMFSTMWVEQPPQMKSIQVWESWALGNNATLLASNIQLPGANALGSGIFHGQKGALAYSFDPDGISKLVVARVPKSTFHWVSPNASITAITENRTWDWEDDGKDVPLECSTKLLNESTDIYKDYRCIEENVTKYTFKELEGSSGHVEACNNGLCCSLDYFTGGLNDRFFLGVFSGIYHHFRRYSWCEEDCILARCEALGNASCATFPMMSQTVFKYVHLRANFTSEMAYTTVLENGMRLVPVSEFAINHDLLGKSVRFENEAGRKLITVGIKGRCYDRDPPYHR
ncbi:biotinidase [Caerostris darwini]|uniref:Biotinidase n=1 Tax=Caerostris darwini TaxID=1538125 RepID=A0AAV4U5F6_9ARAC|nr:biotinidase [Caerostris darwini]